VRCSDYRGIRLVKKLMAMGSEGSKLKQRAEVRKGERIENMEMSTHIYLLDLGCALFF
jgi:hypothetical protein